MLFFGVQPVTDSIRFIARRFRLASSNDSSAARRFLRALSEIREIFTEFETTGIETTALSRLQRIQPRIQKHKFSTDSGE